MNSTRMLQYISVGEATVYSAVKDKDVSAVIPVHNEEETLDQSLISIRRQKVKEIIIVLDRCKDDSEKIAKKHADEDSRIKIFSLHEHKFKTNYVAETLNFGISKAQNDIICTVDADTILGDNYVSSLLPYLRKPVASLSGRIIHLHKRFMLFKETIHGTGRLFPRQLWEALGGFQDIFGWDAFFDLQLLKRGWEVKVIDKAILYDIRNYTMKQLATRAIRRGKGRRQLGQSFPFMLGHGLYYLTRTPFGVVELTANVAGYFATDRKSTREDMRRYEVKRTKEIIRKLTQAFKGR